LPYRWKGKNYTITGTYLDTLRSATACDTFAVLNLTVYPGKVDTTRSTICANQLPFTWRSRSLTTAGTFRDTIAGVSGCDSVSVLLLTINPVIRDTTRADVCASQLPYRWKGRTYSMTGTYLDTLRSTTACDTFAVLNLFVYPIRIDTNRATVCSNNLPYNWRGRNLTVTGTYRDTISGLSSCDSVFVLLLTVNPVIRDTTTADICSSGLPYRWKGKNYTITGTYLDTIRSATACDTFAVLKLTVYPGKVDTTRATVCTNKLPFTWRGRSLSTAGTYRDTIVGVSVCDSVSILLLTINPVIRDTTRAVACANNLPYRWKGSSYTNPGTYLKTVPSTNTCDTFAVLVLSISEIPRDTTRVTICANQTPYNWNGVGYSTSGTYSQTIPGTGGCDTYAVLELVVNPVIREVANIAVCVNKLPYIWRGTAYNAAGSYQKNIPGTIGCDTLAVLNLSVNPVNRDTTRATVCSNNLPFSWKGKSFSQSGTYLNTSTSFTACDTFSVLILTVNPIIRDTLRISTCANKLPYRWRGTDYSTSGTYLKTVPGINACDTFAVLQFTVNDVLRDTSNVTVCANRLPFNWRGSLYSTAGTYLKTLSSNSGCDTFVVLNLTIAALPRDTLRTRVCANTLPFRWRGRSLNTSGTYVDTVASATGGCDTTSVLILQITPLPTLSFSETVCANKLPYIVRGRSFVSTGTYTFLVPDLSGGCDTSVTLNLKVLALPRDSMSVNVCANKLPFRWKGKDITTTGFYIDTLRGVAGRCDTVALLNIRVDSLNRDTLRVVTCSNQLPFPWRGRSIATAGTYIDTAASVTGCDTISVLLLTVNPVLSSLTRDTVCDNQLPYRWNGLSLSTSGNYSLLLRSIAGCDSTARLELVVNPVTYSETRVVICSNELPFVWNGRSYNASGNDQIILRNQYGCDSVTRLILTVNPVVTSTTRVQVCDNQLPYRWNGNEYNTTGSYSVTLKSYLNCDSIAILQLTVYPVLTTTTYDSTCTNRLPYRWNGQSYSATGLYTVILKTQYGCDSIARLNLVVYPVVGSLSYRETCVNQLPYRWNGLSYTASGTYQVVLRSIHNCDSIATLQLTVNPLAYSTTKVARCANQLPFRWNGRDYDRTGTYQAVLTSHLNCDSIATLEFTVNPVVSSVTDVSICADQLPYRWNGNSYLSAGDYSVTLRNYLDCDSIANLRLRVRPLNYSTTIDTVCTNRLPYRWNGVDYSASGDYIFKSIGVNGCDSFATLKLTVVGLPQLTVSGKDSVCTGLKALYTLNFTGRGPWSVTYSENGVRTTVSGITSNPYTLVLSPTANTVYTFVQLTDALCQNDTLNIRMPLFITYPVPGQRLGTVNALANTPVTLKSRFLGRTYTYLWSPFTGLDDPSKQDPVFNYGSGKDYLIKMTSGAGCVTTDTMKVQVFNNTVNGATPDLLVPKAWTPDNDGHNDELFPFTINIVELKYFRIFNRWGQLMFETRQLGKGWNGIFKGQPQPIDAYTWTVEGIGVDGTVIRKAGNSALLR
jgi:gliding motility-associated-like protein